MHHDSFPSVRLYVKEEEKEEGSEIKSGDAEEAKASEPGAVADL